MKISRFIALWKQKAGELELETYTLYYATRDPRVPWYAKGFIGLIVAYAFSPIDLIPDFIPILGYLDDLVIIPLGVMMAIKIIPAQVIDESRARAKKHLGEKKPQYKLMGAIVIGIWIIVIVMAGKGLINRIR
jgi:uncharacterized membrane protein YkvA (DUF1232 family)